MTGRKQDAWAVSSRDSRRVVTRFSRRYRRAGAFSASRSSVFRVASSSYSLTSPALIHIVDQRASHSTLFTMEEIPLPSLFHRALTTASKALNLPTIEDETQVCLVCLAYCLASHALCVGADTVRARRSPPMQLACGQALALQCKRATHGYPHP